MRLRLFVLLNFDPVVFRVSHEPFYYRSRGHQGRLINLFWKWVKSACLIAALNPSGVIGSDLLRVPFPLEGFSPNVPVLLQCLFHLGKICPSRQRV